MAWRRKKGGVRKEPQFGLAAALADLRLDPKDRIPSAEEKPKKPAAKGKIVEDEDAGPLPPPPPRERKVRGKSMTRRRSRSRSRISLLRLLYWGAVLSLWAVILGVGLVIWVGAHLPPIQ